MKPWDVRTKPSMKADPVAETQRRLPLKFSLFSITCIFLLAQSVFQFSALELGLVATAYVLGSFIGSMGFCKIADVYGRAVLFRTVPWFVAALSIAQFVNFSPLNWFISRFLFGLAIGGDSPIAQAMLSLREPTVSHEEIWESSQTAWLERSENPLQSLNQTKILK